MTFYIKDCGDGYFQVPISPLKKMFNRGIFEELKFFLLGQTNAKILDSKGVKVWNGNTSKDFIEKSNLKYESGEHKDEYYAEGTLGPAYGFQWNYFNAEYLGPEIDYTNKGFNQLEYVINTIKNNPESRRILLTSYNPLQVNKCVLPPCHSVVHQYAIEDDNKLCLHMYQRSADVFLGLSWNQAQMGMLLVWMAHVINSDENYKGPKLIPHKVLISLGDCHIYENAIEASKELIERELYEYPKMKINKTSINFADYEWEDIESNTN
jgi:thymidylate synthase